MKSASSQLIDYLNSSQQFIMADLFFILTASGAFGFYTSADIDIPYGFVTYSAHDAIFERSEISCAIGLEVDSMKLMITATSDQTIDGVPWLTAARTGMLDSAEVVFFTLFMRYWGDTTLGHIHRFSGNISDINIEGMTIEADVKSKLELLNIMLPKNVFQPGCIRTLFDSGCKLSKSSFQVSTSVSTAYGTPTASFIPIGAANAAGYFDIGTIEFTSGLNAGLKRSVKLHTSHGISIALPLPYVPANGDTCIVTPGCDKLQSTCDAKFANLPNYRAYPYVPVAETAA